MRVFLDANIYISFLLYPYSESPPAGVVRAGLTGRLTLLVSRTVITEFRRKFAEKPYLASRVPSEDVAAFVDLLLATAEMVPEISEPFPTVGPDRRDDYLFAHALLGRADYLVSGDDGVLRIREIAGVRIVSPAQFIDILESTNQL